MNRLLSILIILAFAASPAAGASQPVRSAPGDNTGYPAVNINGTACWGTSPTGPDFQGVKCIPFQARNPTRQAWEATQASVHRLLAESATPQNIQASYSGTVPGASHPINDFSEVMLYLDPTNSQHLLGASKFFYQPANYLFYTGVFESYDAGLTWTELQPNGVENYSLTSDPVTTFDDVGNGYFTLLTRGPTGLDMLKKPITGTWGLPVVVNRNTGTDKQWIMGDQDPQGASPYAGNLYMSWTDVNTSRIVFSRSIDSNTTWSPYIQLASGDVQGSIPGVAPDGTVYVVYGVGIFYGGSGSLRFVKSTNGGLTFGTSQLAASITAIPFTFPNSDFRTPASLPAFAVSPVNGDLFVAWADYRNGDADIYLTRSTNGGATWSAPVRLNDDPRANGIDQWQPQVTVAPDGRVSVMWFDRRLPCPDLPWIPTAHVGLENYCIDTFMTRSFDGGQTWMPNLRASAQTWDWSINLPRDGSGYGFIGDYQGIASNNEYDFPFWNATANLGQNDENYQEIFIARMPVPTGDLSRSTKTASSQQVIAGTPVSFTVTLDNAGPGNAPGVWVTDTLPVSLTYVADSLTYPVGVGGADPVSGVITWTGTVSISAPLAISFQAIPLASTPDGAEITNVAHILGTDGEPYTRTAAITVQQPPYILSTTPEDGAAGISLTAPILVSFSEPINPASLGITVTPDPGGWVVQMDAGNTLATLSHADFEFSQAYTVTITAEDPDGLPLAAGPTPNPWTFATIGAPPSILATYPADGATGVPITASIGITFSEPVITSTLVYTISTDPGNWAVVWDAQATQVTLFHADFAYSQTYTLTVAVQDADGFPLVAGAAANPWQFTTRDRPWFKVFLPGIQK